jgi:two-component system sensor histidine kinase CpxA
MGTLFWKIFGWFWAAMILVGLALFFVVTTTRPDPLPGPWRDSTGAALAAYASTSAALWEEKGAEAVADYLKQQQELSDYRLWLFDTRGTPLSQMRGESLPPLRRPPPPPVVEGLPLLGRRRPPPDNMWLEMERRAWRDKQTAFEMAGERVWAVQPVQTASGRRYFLRATLPRPRFGRPAADPRTQLLGGLLVLGMSGLVCYALVRYLTSPLITLRHATQRLAQGDLAARTGAASHGRRDEVADLGRDFDTMAERIEALVVAQRRLLGDVSHELRSPLTRLSLALALARRLVGQGARPEEIDNAFERIKRETGRLNTLIEQLLQLVRLESGETQTGHEAVDLEALVRDVVADAAFEGQESERETRLLVSDDCWTTGNADLLRSALENVTRNALRYTPPGSPVEVSLQFEMPDSETAPDETGTAVIRVRDYGEGVPPAALEQLFRPFYRVAEARDRESGGIGLGLAITERAILSHGGAVTACNAPGGGLLVELRLPASRSASNVGE